MTSRYVTACTAKVIFNSKVFILQTNLDKLVAFVKRFGYVRRRLVFDEENFQAHEILTLNLS